MRKEPSKPSQVTRSLALHDVHQCENARYHLGWQYREWLLPCAYRVLTVCLPCGDRVETVWRLNHPGWFTLDRVGVTHKGYLCHLTFITGPGFAGV